VIDTVPAPGGSGILGRVAAALPPILADLQIVIGWRYRFVQQR